MQVKIRQSQQDHIGTKIPNYFNISKDQNEIISCLKDKIQFYSFWVKLTSRILQMNYLTIWVIANPKPLHPIHVPSLPRIWIVWNPDGPCLSSVKRTAKPPKVYLPLHVLEAGTIFFSSILLSRPHARPTSPAFATPSLKSVTCHCIHCAIDAFCFQE